MKTEHKYISYREDKKHYIVTLKINGKKVSKSFKLLDDAITHRDSLLALHNLNPSILTKLIQNGERKEIPTLEDGYFEYVEKEIRPRVAISTYSKYTLGGRQYSKYLGKMKIDEINREVWQEVFSSMQNQRKLSYNYMMDDYRRFRAMYEYYIDNNIVKLNPLNKPIKLQLTYKAKRRAFTEQEQEKFLKSAKMYHPLYYFLFTLYFQTGCRRGELLAVQWQDIDFDNKKIYIRRNIGRGTIDGKFSEVVGKTKNESSIREIPLSADSISKFKILYNSRNEEPAPTDFVFQNISHKVKYDFLSLNSIQRAFTQIRDNARLDRSLTIHCIRHTVASKLLTNGVDLATVQAIGGWASAKTLLNVYAHSNEQAKAKAIQFLF